MRLTNKKPSLWPMLPLLRKKLLGSQVGIMTRVDFFLVWYPRVVAAVQLERCMTGVCILGIVVRKLGHWQKSYLVILFKVDKGSKICLYCTVLAFGLTVYLRVERGRKFLFNSEEVTKRRPKLQNEKWISIRHNWVKQAVVSNYLV